MSITSPVAQPESFAKSSDRSSSRFRELGCGHVALGVTLAVTALHLLIAASVPLDPDEVYYWEWSRRLAAGYYDHPPAIAVLIRAGVAVLGPTSLGVRLLPTLVGSAGMLALVGLAQRLAGGGAALRAALLLACLPLLGVYGCVATQDSAVLAAGAFVLVAVERAVAPPIGGQRALAWWLTAGAALGISLCCKYTAVHLPLGITIAFSLRQRLRAHFASAGPYVACLFALAIFAPVLFWNASHDWISVRHQLSHGFGAPDGSPLGRELNLLGGQLLGATPILFVLMGGAVGRALRRDASDSRFIFAVTAVTVVGFFAMSAVSRPVHANWPALAYLPAALLLAITPGEKRRNRWLGAGSVLGVTALTAFYANAAMPLYADRLATIPPTRGHGWNEVADAVAAARRTVPADGGAPWVAANCYQHAAELAFFLEDHPTVFSLNIEWRANQYDLWPGFADVARPGDHLLFLLEEALEPAAMDARVERLSEHFQRARAGPLVEQRAGASVLTRYRIWILEGWRGTRLTDRRVGS